MPDRRLYFARWDGVQWDGSRKKTLLEGNQTGLKLSEQLTRHGGLRCENVEGLKPLIAARVHIIKRSIQ